MDAKPRVLVIDDDEIALASIEKGLCDFYQVEIASTGEDALDRVLTLKPDFILLGMEMKAADSYDLCARLHQETLAANTPIVLLSGQDNLKDKVRGFEAGGDDFIVKPCVIEELMAKLLVLARFKSQESSLSEQIKSATEVAMTAITGSSEMGQAMTFVEQSYVVQDYDALAQSFLHTCGNLGLSCTLMFLPGNGELFFGGSGRVAPLEAELIQRMYGGKRFVDFGNRTLINYPSAVLLVKNMPVEDPVRYGRIKDLLPSMLGAVDARVKGIETEQALKKQTRDLALGFQAVESTLRGMSEQLKREQRLVTDIMRKLLDDLEVRIPTMGLDDDQEAFLVHRIDRAVEDATAVVAEGAKMGGAFDTVLRLLEHINERQHQIMSRITEDEAERQARVENRSSGAELF